MTQSAKNDFQIQMNSHVNQDWLLSVCQAPQIICMRHHSYFCLFTLCLHHSYSVTSPYYLYIYFLASIIIIIAFRVFVPRSGLRQCFHCS